MAIPQFDENGNLPMGIHECTIQEIGEKFGIFQKTERRILLFNNLRQYFNELKEADVGKDLYVDGSFVTNKEIPNDIDLLLVLKDELVLGAEVPPYKYNPRSKKYIKKNYPFDCFIGFDNDGSSSELLELFSKVKSEPIQRKGILRIIL